MSVLRRGGATGHTSHALCEGDTCVSMVSPWSLGTKAPWSLGASLLEPCFLTSEKIGCVVWLCPRQESGATFIVFESKGNSILLCDLKHRVR